MAYKMLCIYSLFIWTYLGEAHSIMHTKRWSIKVGSKVGHRFSNHLSALNAKHSATLLYTHIRRAFASLYSHSKCGHLSSTRSPNRKTPYPNRISITSKHIGIYGVTLEPQYLLFVSTKCARAVLGQRFLNVPYSAYVRACFAIHVVNIIPIYRLRQPCLCAAFLPWERIWRNIFFWYHFCLWVGHLPLCAILLCEIDLVNRHFYRRHHQHARETACNYNLDRDLFEIWAINANNEADIVDIRNAVRYAIHKMRQLLAVAGNFDWTPCTGT